MAMELSSIRIGLIQHERKSRAGVLFHPNEERSSVPRVDKKDLARRLPQLAYVSGEIGWKRTRWKRTRRVISRRAQYIVYVSDENSFALIRTTFELEPKWASLLYSNSNEINKQLKWIIPTKHSKKRSTS